MLYDLPFGKGRKFDLQVPFLNNAFGGWQTNVILNWQTGLPFTPVLANSVANTGTSRPAESRGRSIHFQPDHHSLLQHGLEYGRSPVPDPRPNIHLETPAAASCAVRTGPTSISRFSSNSP